jgi:wyosine [tRNA(Phe)-imidazoG37] synthetase (radical SAM superfamily)
MGPRTRTDSDVTPESRDQERREKIANAYTKTHYRVLGPHKHSAVKPCHWQEQRLLTGRENRNCYKGYFGIGSHRCVQNTPALPFCNHQCVFCWRDIETGALGSAWEGPVDDPKFLAEEMIRHTQNIIFQHITKERSLENYELMRRVLHEFVSDRTTTEESLPLSEATLAKRLNSTIGKIHRAVLVLKNCDVLSNPSDTQYQIDLRVASELTAPKDVDKILARDVTTPSDIERVFMEAQIPQHAAISLAGEPTLYPRIGELVQEFRNRQMSSFIVTNGTHPEVIRKLWADHTLPTQLYVTLAAPTKESYLGICRPMEAGTWDKLLETLHLLPQLPCRTVVRITAVKYLNIELNMIQDYVNVLKSGLPNFIDIKGFTVEASALKMQKRFKGNHELRDYIPSHQDLMQFAQELCRVGGFELLESHETSRDILLRGSWPKGKSIKIDYSDPSQL